MTKLTQTNEDEVEALEDAPLSVSAPASEPTPASPVPATSETAPASSVAEAPVSAPPPAATPTRARLGTEDAALAAGRPAPAPAAATPAHVLEHGGVLEHVGENHEPDLGAADVDVLQLRHPPVPVGHRHARHLAVHVVLGLDQLPAVHLMNLF